MLNKIDWFFRNFDLATFTYPNPNVTNEHMIKLNEIPYYRNSKSHILEDKRNSRILDFNTIHGNQIIKKGTMNLFNQCYFCEEGNRRGVGFDKPKINNNSLSRYSFGHSGWTGTYTWADPETQIIYVFLSNRSYPDGEVALRSKLVKENIRSKIQEIIYESIIVK